LEKPQSKKRPGYNQYIDDTNMFFPGPRSKKD
jgi:steroid 5-alpha reductase family enzyme